MNELSFEQLVESDDSQDVAIATKDAVGAESPFQLTEQPSSTRKVVVFTCRHDDAVASRIDDLRAQLGVV